MRRWPKRRYAAHTCIVNFNTGFVFCTFAAISDTWFRFYVAMSVEQSPSWEVHNFSASQEYGTPRFITTFAGALHLSLYCVRSVHTPYPTFWRLILILSSHLRLVLPSGLFPLGLSTKILNATHLSSICPKCFPPYSLFDDPSNIWRCPHTRRVRKVRIHHV